MAVAKVGTTVTNFATSTSPNVAWGATPAPGQLLTVCVASTASITPVPASGWTAIGAGRAWLLYKTAGASEPTTASPCTIASSAWGATGRRYTGHNAGVTIRFSQNFTATASSLNQTTSAAASNGVGQAVAGDLMLAVTGLANTGTFTADADWTDGSSVNSRYYSQQMLSAAAGVVQWGVGWGTSRAYHATVICIRTDLGMLFERAAAVLTARDFTISGAVTEATVTTYDMVNAWGLRSVGPEGETDWLGVRAGTPAGLGTGVFLWDTHTGNPDDLVTTGGTYESPDRIVRDVAILGFDASALAGDRVIVGGTLVVRISNALSSSYPHTTNVYALPKTPSGVNDITVWPAGATLAAATPLFRSIIASDPGDDIPITFTVLDPVALDAAINKTGMTWLVLAATDLLSTTYVPGGRGNMIWYGTRNPAAVLSLSHGASGGPTVASTYMAPNAGFGSDLVFTLPVAPAVGQRVIFGGSSQGAGGGTWTALTAGVSIVGQEDATDVDGRSGFVASFNGDGTTTVFTFRSDNFGTDKFGAAWVWNGLDVGAPTQVTVLSISEGDGTETIALAGTPAGPHLSLVAQLCDKYTLGINTLADDEYQPGGANDNRTTFAARYESTPLASSFNLAWSPTRGAILIACAFPVAGAAPGGATATFDAAPAILTARDVVLSPGSRTVSIDAAAAVLTARDLTLGAVIPSQTATFDRAALILTARDLTLTPGGRLISLDRAAALLTARDVALSPGPRTATFDQAAAQLTARPVTLYAGITAQFERAALTLTARDFTLTPVGPGTITQPAAAVLTARDLTLTGGIIAAIDRAAAQLTARDVGLTPGARTVAFERAALVLVARDLTLTANTPPGTTLQFAAAAATLAARDLTVTAGPGPALTTFAPAHLVLVARDHTLSPGARLADLEHTQLELHAQQITLLSQITAALERASVILRAHDLTLAVGPAILVLEPAQLVLIARDFRASIPFNPEAPHRTVIRVVTPARAAFVVVAPDGLKVTAEVGPAPPASVVVGPAPHVRVLDRPVPATVLVVGPDGLPVLGTGQ